MQTDLSPRTLVVGQMAPVFLFILPAAVQALPSQLRTSHTPITFALCHALRLFAVGMPPLPLQPAVHYGTDDANGMRFLSMYDRAAVRSFCFVLIFKDSSGAFAHCCMQHTSTTESAMVL